MKANVWGTPKANMRIIIFFFCNEEGSKVNAPAPSLCGL